MKEVKGVVEKGMVKLPPTAHLPEGAEVRVLWDEKEKDRTRTVLEREQLREEDVQADLQWATGKRFQG